MVFGQFKTHLEILTFDIYFNFSTNLKKFMYSIFISYLISRVVCTLYSLRQFLNLCLLNQCNCIILRHKFIHQFSYKNLQNIHPSKMLSGQFLMKSRANRPIRIFSARENCCLSPPTLERNRTLRCARFLSIHYFQHLRMRNKIWFSI